ncbi:MAG: maleylpyruvate isomerase family mycothiol-dependent enzyme [Acidimicrobiia bacterium]
MSTRTEIIENLERCWASSSTLATRLTPDQWAAPSLCPDWTVQGVFAHLIAIEEVLLRWWPAGPSDPPPFAAIPGIHAELSRAPTGTLQERFDNVVERRRAELAAMDDGAFATPCMTPVGPATYGRFMAIRVFDCWVHERDIRVALGIPGDDAGPAAEMALGEVRGSLGYIVGKRIGLPDGMGIAFDLAGPVRDRLFVQVDGRAAVVDTLAAPDVTVTTDSLTFMLLACGRIDPEAAIADGRIAWSGDDAIGARAARNLRFTM